MNSTHKKEQKQKKNQRNGNKDGKALCRLMNNAVCGKAMENSQWKQN